MKKKLKLTLKKGDLLAVLLVLIIAGGVGAAFLPGQTASEQACVQIYQNGKLIQETRLTDERIIEIAGEYHNVIEIKDGYVSIIESDCPGNDCVHSGKISSTGRSIICLPNHVEVRITGVENDVDFIVG